MSLNGDIVVMRNGRSTSQVSVYNYPEHLNPFYEDDQHKRLRFWHINKKNGGEGRRNSFSIGGLKDMWAFKSFRMKKKSSTLGINKTSESPPQLRRDVQYSSNNGFYTFDDRLARCVSNGNPTNGGNNFQRNIPYRSSLQNVNTSGKETYGSGIGFNRNDQYRSTTQFGGVQRRQQQQQTNTLPASRRYVYGGSVTPQPLRSGGGGAEYGRGNILGGGAGADLTRGSSQISVLTASTNPFDSDDNEDEDDALSGAGSSPRTPTRRTPRKKRRAPAPPVPVHKLNNNVQTHRSTESSQQSPSPQAEQLPELHIEEDLNIANLTAQIESLVDKEDVDKDENHATDTSQETPSKSNGAIPKESITVTTTTTTTPPPPSQIKATAKETQAAHTTPLRVQEEVIYATPVLTRKPLINSNDATAKSDEIGHVECIHIHVESPRATPEPEPVPSRVTSFQPEHKSERKETTTARTSYTISSPTAMRRETVPSANTRQKEERVVVITTNTLEKTTLEKTSPKVSKLDELKITETPKESHDSKLKITEELPSSNEVTIKSDAATVKPTIKPPIANKPNLDGKTRVSFQAEVHKPRTISETNDASCKITEEVRTSAETQQLQAAVPASIRVVETTTAEIRRPTAQLKKDAPEPEPTHLGEKSTKEVRDPTSSSNNSTNLVSQVPTSSCKVETTTITTTAELESKAADAASPTSPIPALKIVESKETILQTASNQNTVSAPIVAALPPPTRPMRSRDEFEALYRPKPSTQHEWKQSTLAPLETNVPPEKRKSVKDIIESINRSQRLLKNAANKEMSQSAFSDSEESGAPIAAKRHHHHLGGATSSTTTTTVIERKLSEPNNDLNQRQRNEQPPRRLFEETETRTTNQANGNASAELETSAAASGGGDDLEQNNNNNDPQKLNNAEVFKKCVITKEVYHHRESSPTASNLDWNPVPKPKRTKNLAEI